MNHIQRRTVHSAHRFERLPLFGSPSAMANTHTLSHSQRCMSVVLSSEMCVLCTNYERECICDELMLCACLCWIQCWYTYTCTVDRTAWMRALDTVECTIWRREEKTTTFNTYSNLYTKLQKIIRTQTSTQAQPCVFQSIACKKSWKRFRINSTTVAVTVAACLLLLPFSTHAHTHDHINDQLLNIFIWKNRYLMFQSFIWSIHPSAPSFLHFAFKTKCVCLYACCILTAVHSIFCWSVSAGLFFAFSVYVFFLSSFCTVQDKKN